jgi:penicillin amidase
MVVDLGNLDASRWVNQTGASGNPGSPHYDDQLSAWATGKTFAWPFSEPAVKAASRDSLTLDPSK